MEIVEWPLQSCCCTVYFCSLIFFTSFILFVVKNRFHTWIPFAMKTYRKESPACRVGILWPGYHSSSYTDRSSRLPVYHFTNQLACFVFYDCSTVGLGPKSNPCVYLWKKIMARKDTHTTRAMTHNVPKNEVKLTLWGFWYN